MPLDFELFITLKRLFLEKQTLGVGGSIFLSDNTTQGNTNGVNNPSQGNANGSASVHNGNVQDRIASLRRENTRLNDKIKSLSIRIGVELDREDYDEGRFSMLTTRLARLNQQKTYVASQLDLLRGNSTASLRNYNSRASRYLRDIGLTGRRNN